MIKKCLLTIILFLIFIYGVSALTAESDSYSVGRFGIGMQAASVASDNLEARTLLTTEASTRNAENGNVSANIGFWGNVSHYSAVSPTSPTSPTTPPSSGSERSTTITENCTYIWNCTSWSICSGKKQERECKNTGNCIGTEGKPIESKECLNESFAEQNFEVENKTVETEKPTSKPNNILTGALFIPNIVGRAIGIGEIKTTGLIFIFTAILVLALLIILRKKVIRLIFSIGNRYRKLPKNSINSLINKEVYSESGHYIGKIVDIILMKNRIENLKIKIDKKHKFAKKGIIINYRRVKSIGEIVIIDKIVAEYLKN